MKKTTVLLTSLLLCLLVLSGCECKHTWTEADCLTAKTCTECGVVEGEALGHDWAAATCDAPETCTRCGETQGQALEHVMGKWNFTDSTMVRTCELCGMEEVTDIDREMFVKDEIAGYYDFYVQMTSSEQISIHDIDSRTLSPYINIYPDGTLDFYTMDETLKCNWEYLEYTDREDYDLYTLRFQVQDDEDIYGVINCFYTEEGVTLNVPMSDTVMWMFVDNMELAPHMVGTWATNEAGELYTITLNEDRTFTADFGEDISGIWQLRFPYVSGEYRYAGLTLSYELNGETVTITDTAFDLGHKDTTIEEYVSDYFYISARINEEIGYSQFQKMNKDQIQQLQEALEKGNNMILGDWTSIIKNIFYYDDREHEEIKTNEYSISFREDGTFTLKLDEEKAGTWAFHKVDVDEWSTRYTYILTPDGEASNTYIYLSEYTSGNIDIDLNIGSETETISYTFEK